MAYARPIGDEMREMPASKTLDFFFPDGRSTHYCEKMAMVQAGRESKKHVYRN